MNQHARYVGQRSFSSKVVVRYIDRHMHTHTHTHTLDGLLYVDH